MALGDDLRRIHVGLARQSSAQIARKFIASAQEMIRPATEAA
jgi:hypothetical protein